MARLDINALKSRKKQAEESTGSTLMFRQKQLTEETEMRIMPPSPRLNGIPMMEVKRIWIKNGDKWQSFISYSTFTDKEGKEIKCPGITEIEKASQSSDMELVELATDEERIKVDKAFWMPILLLQEDEENNSYKVIDDKEKIFEFTSKPLYTDILKCLTGKISGKLADKAEDGILDRVIGHNISASKTKTGERRQDVEYAASISEQCEMPAKYYNNPLDVYEYAKSLLVGKEYLRAVVRKYLYGEDIPAAVEKEEEARKAKRRAEYQAKQKAAAAAKPKKATDESDDLEGDAPPFKVPAKKIAPAKQQVEKKTAKRKAADDDDLEDDLEVALEKAEARANSKKKLNLADAVNDDLEDDEELESDDSDDF